MADPRRSPLRVHSRPRAWMAWLLSIHLLAAGLLSGVPAWASDTSTGTFIVVASTTSTQNSGLYDHILPIFQKKTGIEARVVAVGTGQAIRLAERGDADVLLVHHKASEKKFIKDGFGVERHPLMYNDFVIVGPKTDPAGIKGMTDAAGALVRIAEAKAPFASRGDDSGTHKAERKLWQEAKRDVDTDSGSWYRETGSGMGSTLNTASGMNAYTLTDRGTWLNFGNRGDLVVLVEGDPRLRNEYSVILVNPEKHPHVKKKAGQAFIGWLLSEEGQSAIANYRIGGEALFNVMDASPLPPPAESPKDTPPPASAQNQPRNQPPEQALPPCQCVGREEVLYTCQACHSIMIVKQQNLSRSSWDETLTWMVEEQGMQEPEPETRGRILDYLTNHFGLGPPKHVE